MNELIAALERQTRVMSSPDQMRATTAFKEIVAAGDAAVPPLLAVLRDDEEAAAVPIMLVLGEITGENPAAGARGDVDDAVAAWLGWGEAKGLI